MGRIILVTGGARSGKSRFAEQLAADLGGRIAYIATAAPWMPRWRTASPATAAAAAAWPTFEAPLSAAAVVAAEGGRCDGFLLDCLTVLITNRILAREADWDNPPMELLADIEADVLVEIEALLAAAAGQPAPLIAVTNEVGCGIVPLSPLARFFRDCAGRANQRMAAAADEVHLVVSGIPLCIKGGRSGPCVP